MIIKVQLNSLSAKKIQQPEKLPTGDVSSVEYIATNKKNCIFITLPDSTKYTKPSVAHARVAPVVWNKGTSEERTMLTLDWVHVPLRDRDKGIGKKLIQATLSWMCDNKIPFLVFDNYAQGFWASVTKNFPKLVVWPKGYSKRIGILRQSSSVDTSDIF